jgi:hypothetical protein
LEKVPGVSNIETDIESATCRFYMVKGEVDLEAKLNELAEGNDHIEGWSFAEAGG